MACDVKHFLVFTVFYVHLIYKNDCSGAHTGEFEIHFPGPVIQGFRIGVRFEIFITILSLQVIVWDCLNNYEYDNAIFLAERLHAEGIFPISLCTLPDSFYT